MSWKWQDALWAELDEMEVLQQYTKCSEWITEMQQTLVPALAAHRRAALIAAVEAADMDYYRIAEQIGSRKATIERLVNEGRAMRRDHEQHRLAQ